MEIQSISDPVRSDAGLSGADARGLSADAFHAIPAMKEKMADAFIQVAAYEDAINLKYGDLNLRRYAVVPLGYKRIWWQAA